MTFIFQMYAVDLDSTLQMNKNIKCVASLQICIRKQCLLLSHLLYVFFERDKILYFFRNILENEIISSEWSVLTKIQTQTYNIVLKCTLQDLTSEVSLEIIMISQSSIRYRVDRRWIDMSVDLTCFELKLARSWFRAMFNECSTLTCNDDMRWFID